jgi:Flp pilus assembly protein TadG
MTPGRLSALAGARGGATAVEFALVAPLFLALVFGTTEFGRLLWIEQALQETAIAGARCVAIAQSPTSNPTSSPCASGGSYSPASATTYIQKVASGWGLSLPTSNIFLYPEGNSSGCTGLSQVTLTSTFTSVVPSLVQLGGGITLSASACYPNINS